MSVEDPFSVVRGEVQKSLNTSQGLYQRWCELLQEGNVTSAEEFDWTTNELRNSLRSIEWDLEDLEETINIVEANTKKFKITEAELSERRNFVEKTRSSLKEMRDHISSPRVQAFTERKNREALGVSRPTASDHFSRLDDDLISGNSRYIEDQQAQQQIPRWLLLLWVPVGIFIGWCRMTQLLRMHGSRSSRHTDSASNLIIDTQDTELELVSGSIRVLKDMSGRIGDELDEQSVMLDGFSHEMDNTQTRMDSVLKRLAKVSHMTSDRRQWCAIIVLVAALLILLIVLLSQKG